MPRSLRLLRGLIAALAAGACAAPVAPEADDPPRGRLPAGVRPLHYRLELTVVPELEHFGGSARIRVALDRPVERIWLHGRDLALSSAWAGMEGQRPGRARWEQVTEEGVAVLRLEQPLGPGNAELHFAWSAPFGRTLRGLYRVEVDDEAYAFSQLEAISARRVFPCFDEPAFKTPFDITLVVRGDQRAITSSPAVAEEKLGWELRRIRFATTPPLPTYLLAFAVGPLDVVEAAPLPPGGPRAHPVPFRGVAARGRGGELRYALAHTPALVADLEGYFDVGYPYSKLDVIAVPDFAAGAMENVGAITFRDSLLLLDSEAAPEEQRRGFTYVMAHELAHQWFGNLVTMLWWDDLWLNEAFATWLGSRSVARVRPEQGAERILLQHVHAAMDADSLGSARSIRQPIASHHDIRNAFDAITYSKGAGVLGMFERWLGEPVFRDGIRRYVARHREGSARAEDLMAALAEASGRPVAEPFHSFLSQPGVPFVEVETRCGESGAELRLRQSRYLPLGSQARRDVLWSLPVCARHARDGQLRESCVLLDSRQGRLPLEGRGCPDWVMPNADAAGYYRFAQPPADAERLLTAGFPELSARERMALADALGAALRAGARPAAEIYAALPRLASDPVRAVATAPMELLGLAREHLADASTRPAVERHARGLYRPLFQRLGWRAADGEDGETRLLREQLLRFLVEVGRDAELRREAARRGRLVAGLGGPVQPRALEPELVETGLALALREGGAPLFDALEGQLFQSRDALVRGQRLAALAHAEDPELAARARALALDERLRVNEVLPALAPLAARQETRAATWAFVQQHFDALVARLGAERAGRLTRLAAGFCDAARAAEVEAFFSPRIDALLGGPRELAAALEKIRLCVALVEAQGASARAFFAAQP